MKIIKKIIPYLCLLFSGLVIFVFSLQCTNIDIKNILLNVLSNVVFFFIAYLFYDLIRELIYLSEKKYLTQYLNNLISNDIIALLYNLRKIIYGYSLETNTINNILGLSKYNKKYIYGLITNQEYLGFQILKNTKELEDVFSEVVINPLILKYEDHLSTIDLLKIIQYLQRLESLLQNIENYKKSAESGIEYSIVKGKSINPENDDKLLLLKKTKNENRFVVYDSGYFDTNKTELLLNKYVLKDESAVKISVIIYEIIKLSKKWIPTILIINKRDSRFRIIKDFINAKTDLKTNGANIHTADIIDSVGT